MRRAPSEASSAVGKKRRNARREKIHKHGLDMVGGGEREREKGRRDF